MLSAAGLLLAMGLISKIGGEIIFTDEREKQDALKQAKQLLEAELALLLMNTDTAPSPSETILPVKENAGFYSRLKEYVKNAIHYAGNVVGRPSDRTQGITEDLSN